MSVFRFKLSVDRLFVLIFCFIIRSLKLILSLFALPGWLEELPEYAQERVIELSKEAVSSAAITLSKLLI